MSAKNSGQATKEPRTAGKAAGGKQAAARQAARSSAQDGQTSAGDPIEAVQRFATEWGPTVGRVALGLVLAWFGYHELVAPQLWTGYVPLVSSTSSFAVILVLVHGWLLLLLAVAIVAGVALRLAAAVSALLLAEIIISLIVSGGLTDISLRDVGVFGLAVMLTTGARQRLALRD